MRWPPSKKDITVGSICLMLIGAGLSTILGPITAWAAVALGGGILIGNYLPRNEAAAKPAAPVGPSYRLPPPPKPRLKRFGTRSMCVHVPYDSSYFAETDLPDKKALLAIFENEVHGSQKVGYIGDVSGKILFKDEKGKEIPDLRVQHGCWLNASAHEVHFPPNAQHALIVATKDGYKDTRIVREAYRHSAELKNTKFKQEKLYVEVALIAKGETLVTGHYILLSTDKEFSLTEVEE